MEFSYQSPQSATNILISSWNIQNPTLAAGDRETSCGSITLLGGVGKFTTTTEIGQIFTLTPHYQVLLEMNVVIIDQWKIGKYLTIQVDDEKI